MKTLIPSTAAALLLTFAGLPVFAESPKTVSREVTLDACPAPVKEAVNRALKDGKLDDVHSVTRNGQTFYAVEIHMPDHRDVTLHIQPDGAVTRTVTELRLKDAPEPVRAALLKLAVEGAKVEDVEQVVEGDTTTWRAEIDRRAAPDLKAKVAADGTVLEQREERPD